MSIINGSGSCYLEEVGSNWYCKKGEFQLLEYMAVDLMVGRVEGNKVFEVVIVSVECLTMRCVNCGVVPLSLLRVLHGLPSPQS